MTKELEELYYSLVNDAPYDVQRAMQEAYALGLKDGKEARND